MELHGRSAKRRRSEDLAAGEPPPRAFEATEKANPGPTTNSKEPPPPLSEAGGGGGGGVGGVGDGNIGIGDDVDRISGLPDAILREIVSLLSTKEAGRTQILASRWRRVWLASPLVLDGADLYKRRKPKDILDASSDESSEDSDESSDSDKRRKPKDILDASSDESSEDSDESSDSDDEEKAVTATFKFQHEEALTAAYNALAGAVIHILSAHPGPVRRFCIPSLYLHSRPTTVEAWFSSPKLDNLQELEFFLGDGMVWYIQPSSLALPPASTFRFSATLRVATLSGCVILDSSVEGIHFPYLKQLGLEDFSISEGSLRTIISRCPVLECLLLTNCFGVGGLQISSNSLRSICVGVGRHRENLIPLHEVIIVAAPRLERFLYLGTPVNLTVISAPKLETLGCLKDDGYHCRTLVIGATAIQGLNVVSSTTAFSNVKILAVKSSPHMHLDTVIELLKCFPCLEKLYIKSSISGQMNLWHRKHKDFIKSFDIRLKTVVLKEYRGTKSQVNFASFFLLNARELESMRLEVELTNYNEAFFTKQHEMLQMEKRASRGARLHFTQNTCARDVHVNHVRDLSIADPFECRC